MKLNLLILISCVIVTMGITYVLNQPVRPNIQEVPVDTVKEISDYPPAPDFSFLTVDNKNIELKSLEGKIVVLNFWASWCAPCKVEFPQLLEMAAQTQENVIFLAVSVDAEKENISKFFSSFDANIQQQVNSENVIIAWDPEKKISQDLFQTIRYPETYIIGPDLTLRQKIIGASVDFSSKEFLENLLKELN